MKEVYEFGENWTRFLKEVDHTRIAAAEASLRRMLRVEDLKGKTFLDIGSGSGLFSLAARNLGARVTSFDADPQSAACTRELQRRYHPDDPDWSVDDGSVLDQEYLGRLGTFDVVYSWGVLHHTGAMWNAIANAASVVAPGGRFYIALYNKTGSSGAWVRIKRFYVRASAPVRAILEGVFVAKSVAGMLLRGRDPVRFIRDYPKSSQRGMHFMTDVRDWMGGYPYEYASVDEVSGFLKPLGFSLVKVDPNRGTGCSEFLFTREIPA